MFSVKVELCFIITAVFFKMSSHFLARVHFCILCHTTGKWFLSPMTLTSSNINSCSLHRKFIYGQNSQTFQQKSTLPKPRRIATNIHCTGFSHSQPASISDNCYTLDDISLTSFGLSHMSSHSTSPILMRHAFLIHASASLWSCFHFICLDPSHQFSVSCGLISFILILFHASWSLW